MKKTLMTRLLPLFFLVLACKSPSPNNIENIEQVDSTLVSNELFAPIDVEIAKEMVTCSEKVINKYKSTGEEDFEGEFEDIETTCAYKSLKIITITHCDYRGYCNPESMTLYEKDEKDKYVKVKNMANIFNERKNELLDQINKAFRNEFNKNIKDPNFMECYESNAYKNHNFNTISISFSEYGFSFLSYAELYGYCYSNPGPLTFSLTLDEMEKYLK